MASVTYDYYPSSWVPVGVRVTGVNNNCPYDVTYSVYISGTVPVAKTVNTSSVSACNAGTNTVFTTNANLGEVYSWQVSPTGAGTIIGSGSSISVDWSNTFTGTGSVRVMAQNGCGNGPWSAYKSVSVVSGSCRMALFGEHEVSSGLGISLYPNPTEGDVTLRVDRASSEKVELEVTDMKGIIKYTASGIELGSEIIFGSELPAGMYIVKATDGQETKVIKFVKK